MMDLSALARAAKNYAEEARLLTDISDVGYAVPGPAAGVTRSLQYLLIYVTPDEAKGYADPSVSAPFAVIVLDAVSGRLIRSEKRPRPDGSAKAFTDARRSLDTAEARALREVFMKVSGDVFNSYWTKTPPERVKVSAKDYLVLFDAFAEVPLRDEYRKLNPDFFRWVEQAAR